MLCILCMQLSQTLERELRVPMQFPTVWPNSPFKAIIAYHSVFKRKWIVSPLSPICLLQVFFLYSFTYCNFQNSAWMDRFQMCSSQMFVCPRTMTILQLHRGNLGYGINPQHNSGRFLFKGDCPPVLGKHWITNKCLQRCNSQLRWWHCNWFTHRQMISQWDIGGIKYISGYQVWKSETAKPGRSKACPSSREDSPRIIQPEAV